MAQVISNEGKGSFVCAESLLFLLDVRFTKIPHADPFKLGLHFLRFLESPTHSSTTPQQTPFQLCHPLN
jgi:hypothetical protein